MPASIDAERTIIGSILLDSKLYYQAGSLLPHTFSLGAHQDIWTAIQDLHALGQPIDFVTLQEELGKRKGIESIGGTAYLSTLIDGVPDPPCIDTYVKMVR